MLIRCFAFGAIALALTACSQSPVELAAARDAECQSYGAKPGSDAYVECRARLAQAATQADATRRAAIVQSLADKPKPEPYQIVKPPVRTQTNCTSDAIGSTVYTNCNTQ